jgi:Fe-S-cluster containining protein
MSSQESIVQAVSAIYEELARRPVERTCVNRTECCQFKLTGATPYLTLGEAIVAAKGLRAAGRKHLPERADGACPMLKTNGKCMIYSSRPLGCRTHFCEAAGGPYSRREVLDLIRKLEEIDARNGGKGPLPIQTAVAEALEVISRPNRERAARR